MSSVKKWSEHEGESFLLCLFFNICWFVSSFAFQCLSFLAFSFYRILNTFLFFYQSICLSVLSVLLFLSMFLFFSLRQFSLCYLFSRSSVGPSINDVTALGGRGYKGFCDNSTKALVLKSVTMGGASVINYQKLRDVIYGRPLYLFPICLF